MSFWRHCTSESIREALATVAANRDPDPRAVVECAVSALCWAPELQSLAVGLLAEHLPRISPPSARLAALGGVDMAPAGPVGEQLLALTFPQGVDPSVENPWDVACLGGLMAELHRIAGHDEVAAAQATAAAEELGTSSGFAWWPWLQAMKRIRGVAGLELDPPVGPWEEHREYRLLIAAYHLTRVEMRLRSYSRQYAEEILTWVEEDVLAGRREDSAWWEPAVARLTHWHLLVLDLRRRLAEGAENEPLAAEHADAADNLRTELGQPGAHGAGRVSVTDVPTPVEVAITATLNPAGRLTVVERHC